MATWMIHFRIADYFVNKFNIFNNNHFIVGNIGPDCNIYNLYDNFKGELDTEYRYFSKTEADNFITKCSNEIEKILIQKGIIDSKLFNLNS